MLEARVDLPTPCSALVVEDPYSPPESCAPPSILLLERRQPSKAGSTRASVVDEDNSIELSLPFSATQIRCVLSGKAEVAVQRAAAISENTQTSEADAEPDAAAGLLTVQRRTSKD